MNGLFEASALNWSLIALAAFIIGLSKAGIKGIDMMNVTLMAIVFGGKASTGIVLPLLCLADILAVRYYHRHAQWDHFWKLLPWMVAGILVGVFVGKDLDETVFRKIMAAIILLTVALVLLLEWKKRPSIPHNRLFVATMGLTSGFTTMLGNLAGAFSNIYFLALRMVKNDFIGTAAWVFLVINLFKLPFQVFFWKNITPATLWIDLLLLPALLLGFFAGIRLVSRIKDDSYRKVVLVLTLIGAAVIFFKR
ncbi:sulfite exporter TauE/SafE family protein [Paraflavisolibacter sp. H34]|uniref:sulfite exporter TauE/SafE family protein n=1 Tax=Huijunlia imazamoxiresistens TaxID=3127457 RepID=UPI0030173D23